MIVLLDPYQPTGEIRMTTLTAAQLAQLERTLDKRHGELLATLRGVYGDLSGTLLPQTRGPETHRDETSVREAYDDVRSTLALHDRQELRQIEQALARISQDRYGECVECGTLLSFDRLAAAPYATRCVMCQTAFERRDAAARTGSGAG